MCGQAHLRNLDNCTKNRICPSRLHSENEHSHGAANDTVSSSEVDAFCIRPLKERYGLKSPLKELSKAWIYER
jgi:hypothetical protein